MTPDRSLSTVGRPNRRLSGPVSVPATRRRRRGPFRSRDRRSREHKENLRLLLARALNKNQILILSQVKNTKNETITRILNRISFSQDIPLSTLKLNAKILKDLNLITFGNNSHFQAAKLTDFGRFIFKTIRGDRNV